MKTMVFHVCPYQMTLLDRIRYPVQDSILQMGGTDNELLPLDKEPSIQQQLETSGRFKSLLELWLLWQKSALLGTRH